MELTQERIKSLAALALEQRNFSYVPYSGFRVGAALLSKSGRIFTGCNIENSAFSPTVCAERTAIFKAVSEGVTGFDAIFVAGGAGDEPDDYCPPCGVCRQVMMEFCDPDFKIYLVKSPEDWQLYTLEEILPLGFKL